jgi:hydrogenase-4 component B
MVVGAVVLVFGLLSAVMGVLYALMQHDLKRLLAYHSVENIGIILIGIGLCMVFTSFNMPLIAALALTAGLYHTMNHAMF